MYRTHKALHGGWRVDVLDMVVDHDQHQLAWHVLDSYGLISQAEVTAFGAKGPDSPPRSPEQGPLKAPGPGGVTAARRPSALGALTLPGATAPGAGAAGAGAGGAPTGICVRPRHVEKFMETLRGQYLFFNDLSV